MPGKKPKRVWPTLLMLLLADEHVCRDIIERVRDEFHMAAPADKACVALNRGPEEHFPARRDKVLARVEKLCGQTTWTGDFAGFGVMFHPEEAVEEATPTSEDLAALPPFSRALAEVFFDMLPTAMQQIGYGSIKYRIVHWLADYAIHGDYTEIKPMPIIFDSDLIELPFCEDKLVVALVSRFSDIEKVVDKLRVRRRQAFVKRSSNGDPENIERNTWLWIEYERIKSSSPRLGRTKRLLDSFRASRWGYQFDGYDFDNYEDQRRADDRLRKWISRARNFARNNIPEQPALFCDG